MMQEPEPDAYICAYCQETYKASQIEPLFAEDDDFPERKITAPCGHSLNGLFDLVIEGKKPPNLLGLLFG